MGMHANGSNDQSDMGMHANGSTYQSDTGMHANAVTSNEGPSSARRLAKMMKAAPEDTTIVGLKKLRTGTYT